MFLHDFERNTFDVIDYKKLEKNYIKALPLIYNIFLCWADDKTEKETIKNSAKFSQRSTNRAVISKTENYIDQLKKLCEDKHKIDKSRITKQRIMWYIEDVLPLIKVYLEDKRELGIEIILAHLFILNSYLDTKMQPKIYNYILSGNRKSYENTYIKDVVVIYKKYAAILMMKHENTE